MKKLTSVLITWALLATTSIASVSAQEVDPFANVPESTGSTITNTSLQPNKINAGEVNVETNEKKEDAAVAVTEVKTDVMVEKVWDDKVKMTISFDSDVKAKTSEIAIKFPDVVTITEKDVVKGDLFDSVKTTVENWVLIVKSESVTAIPTKGTVLTATFNVKPATIKQDYPFTIDIEKSEVMNELNESVKLKTEGVKMIELATAAPVVEEVKKETGFEENVALATILWISALAFVASTRRRKSI